MYTKSVLMFKISFQVSVCAHIHNYSGKGLSDSGNQSWTLLPFAHGW